MKNCIDIIKPFINEMATTETSNGAYQLIGGVGSAALGNTASQFSPSDMLVTAPTNLFLGNFRDDGNKRDADILVLSADTAAISAVRAAAEHTIGDELELSIFGMRPTSVLDAQRTHPLGFRALKTFLSDRYIAPEADQPATAQKALFPFAVPIDPDSLSGWRLAVGGYEAPISHPGASILNYTNRSISGLRPKDAVKVDQLARTVFTACPEILDWIIDGPGSSQLELSRILHTLRSPKDSQPLLIGDKLRITPLTIKQLLEHDSFMLHNASSRAQSLALRVARIKSRGLHGLETNPRLVTFYQKYIESKAGTIVNNS